MQQCLEGVCIEGTAAQLFKNNAYKVAGKTGTALVANGKEGYDDMIYQSSFAGYFPADNPQYTCVVVIKNKPHALHFYGAEVAGPVFKEISDRLYTTYVHQTNYATINTSKPDSSIFNYVGLKQDITQVLNMVKIPYKDDGRNTEEVVNLNGNSFNSSISEKMIGNTYMPSLKGMGLKDAVVLCETMGLKIAVKGKGKVTNQSIAEGQSIAHGQLLNIELN